ncbi:PDS5 [[Candida] subhashii]|uniref:PDS5 n=1 Tax=[Candida] subhashii TaxID=561895 RepID=A0A8J5QHT8_9ASCO|nr:PDS5 [[Candida] subhashii]KAG7661421.1 PDS5 [[Candida] subhashii]
MTNRSQDPTLQFNKSLVPSVKDPISNKELLYRLQTLNDELSTLDTVDLKSLQPIQTALINKKLLSHTNVGVQIYACSCVADILRLSAPDAPYTAEQLSEIFKAFIRQFKRLGDRKNSHFQQHCYLLKRLVEAKSMVLITDVPDSEVLIESIFETFYGLTKANEFPTELENLISDILSEVVSEADIVPHNVVKSILNKFLIHEPNKLVNGHISSPAFNFSLAICESNIDRMSRLVAQYFSEILYDSSVATEEDEEEKIRNSSKSMENLKMIHRLCVQLWRFIPQILTSVMTLIDDELNADDEKIRIMATETIGDMLSCSDAKANFFVVNQQTWTNWLKKTSDISPDVRASWIKKFAPIISSNIYTTTEVNSAFSTCLKKCLLDTEEKVRATAISSLEQVPLPKLTANVINTSVLQTLFQLIRERSHAIRNSAIRLLGSLYDYYEKHLEDNGNEITFSNDEESKELDKIIKTIPNQILSLVYINDKDITAIVDLCLFDYLAPISENDSTKRVNRLLRLYSGLDEKGKESFVAINKRQQQVSKVLTTFLEIADTYNKQVSITDNKENNEGNAMEQKSTLVKLDKIINWFCVSFPEGHSTFACLERLFKLNRSRFMYLIRMCISPESDFNTVKNSMKELFKKLSEPKNIRLEGDRTMINTSEMVYNIKLLLLRSSVLLYNKSNVVELIKCSKDLTNQYNPVSNELLQQISLAIPDVFKFHVRELTSLIIEQRQDGGPKSNTLKTIYHFVKKYPDLFPRAISFCEALKKIAIDGTPREARYAVKILGLSESKESLASEVFEQIYPLDLEHEKFATHLSTIAELFVVDRLCVTRYEEDITALIVKEIFLKNRGINRDEIKDDQTWIAEDELDDNYKLYSTLYEKLLAIRLLTNSLKGFQEENMTSEEKEEAKSKAQPVIKLLMSYVGNNGEIIKKGSATYPTPEPFKSKLRLSAGLYLLKLAQIPVFSETLLSASLRRMTFLLNDDNYDVRSRFMISLQRKLSNELISERFLALLFFASFEPTPELKNNATISITSAFKRSEAKKNIKFERSLVRLIHILAHHEQYLALSQANRGNDESKTNAYKFATICLTYFVTLIAKSDSISLLYYLASRIKQHRDATLATSMYEEDELSETVLNLYRISELAQLVIKEYSDYKNWPIQTWQGKIKLPTDIYAPMASPKEAQSIVARVFIPEEIQIKLINFIRKTLNVGNKRKLLPTENSGHTSKKQKIKPVVVKKQSKPKEKSEKVVVRKKSVRTRGKVNYEERSSDSESDVDYEE